MRRAVSLIVSGLASFFIGVALIILTRNFWISLAIALVVDLFLYIALLLIL